MGGRVVSLVMEMVMGDVVKAIVDGELSFWDGKPDDYMIEVPRDVRHTSSKWKYAFNRSVMVRMSNGAIAYPSEKGRRFVRLGDLRGVIKRIVKPPKKSSVFFMYDELRRFGVISDESLGTGLINLTDLCNKLGVHRSILEGMAPFRKGHIIKRTKDGKEW